MATFALGSGVFQGFDIETRVIPAIGVNSGYVFYQVPEGFYAKVYQVGAQRTGGNFTSDIGLLRRQLSGSYASSGLAPVVFRISASINISVNTEPASGATFQTSTNEGLVTVASDVNSNDYEPRHCLNSGDRLVLNGSALSSGQLTVRLSLLLFKKP